MSRYVSLFRQETLTIRMPTTCRGDYNRTLPEEATSTTWLLISSISCRIYSESSHELTDIAPTEHICTRQRTP